MLESLEKLRGGVIFGEDGFELSTDKAQKLADEIQAEVDEKYMPRVPDEYWPLIECIENRAKPEELEKLIEIAERHGSLDAYIDKFYLPRPLFEDGEPVQIGDYVDLQMDGKRRVQVTDIQPWIVYGNSTSHQKEPYKRPPEPDTQEKIDADYRNETNNLIVDSGRGCMTRERALEYVERLDELMARQRKLDGVE